MKAIELSKDIFTLSVNDRTTDLFEGLWPITQEGVTYNSYIVRDKKTAVIDLVKDFKTDLFFDQLRQIVDPAEIDYIIINHMEPDHTGALKTIGTINPNVQFYCSPKAKPMIEAYYGITENIHTVEDGETLSLGSKTLTFYHAPFVHWPETMVTFEADSGILFSCDAFGGYGALPGSVFDGDAPDLDWYIEESLRYFTNIVAKFTKPVLNAIEKLSALSIKMIAPSHGLIWKDNPGQIIELYKKWSEYGKGDNELGVTLLYGSMYGNTELMMNYVAKGIADEGVPVKVFDVARTHMSYILPHLWTNKAVVIGAPTYEGNLYPNMALALEEASIKRVLNKKCAYFGSYGWSGGALRVIKKIIEPLKWDLSAVLDFHGGPSQEDLEKGLEFGRNFAKSLK